MIQTILNARINTMLFFLTMDEKRPENDHYLVEACIKKDISAWSRLVKKYSRLICISIENRIKKYNLSASTRDIEDIKQNILTDIWKNNRLESITNRGDISYWISIVSGNAAIEHFRGREVRQEQRTTSLFDKIGEREPREIIPSEIANPRDELIRAEASNRIYEAIESLPGKERLMIKLHLIHDKKYREIAEILSVPKGTVSNCIKRAKDKLKRALKNI